MDQNRDQKGWVRQGAMSAVLLLGIVTTQAAPLPKSPIPLAPLGAKSSSSYQYQADTLAEVKKSGQVTASGIRWNCSASRCTTSGPWPTPGVAACQALAKQVGRIRSYGHSNAKLNGAQLAQCNAGIPKGVTVATVKKPAGAAAGSGPGPGSSASPAGPAMRSMLPPSAKAGPQPEPPTRPGASAAMAPRMGASGAAGMLPALPGAGGGAAPAMPGGFGRVPPRGAADEIRNAAAARGSRPVIDRLADDTGASCTTGAFVVSGRNFGSAQGSRQLMFMTRVRNTPIRTAYRIDSWSDSRITAVAPASRYAQPGQSYVVAIVDGTGNPLSNTNREIRICPNQLTVSGNVRITNCGAGAGNVRIGAYRDGRLIRSVRGEAVPGNDFAVRYQLSLSPSSSSSEVELRPELADISCPGGGWLPDRARVTLDYDHARASQDFEYRVGMTTRRIPMSLVSGLVQSAFRGSEIRVNNYDPASGRVRENDSFVRLSDALGGSERRFNIGPAVTGPRKYYINDINLASTRVRPAGEELRVAIAFETGGMELIGTCGQDGFDAGCIAGAPDVQASIAVDIFFTLDRYYSRAAPISLSFSRVRVVPRVDAQADGLCLALDFLCSAINDYRTLIRNVVERSFMAVLDTNQVRDEVARALLPSLRDLNIGTLNSVRIEGNDLVLTYLEDIE